MLDEIGHFRPDWFKSQFHPEDIDFEIEDEKPA